ncbi:uncharacterized protein BKA78DRAFT_319903 [Phyllosticta capitalensis]|uniref:DUF7924 domain-containing protein n=1 Tax=Phyllosticta capitalensis TaxID=121624 RepID=A0ABR1Y9J4_9PEZI
MPSGQPTTPNIKVEEEESVLELEKVSSVLAQMHGPVSSTQQSTSNIKVEEEESALKPELRAGSTDPLASSWDGKPDSVVPVLPGSRVRRGEPQYPIPVYITTEALRYHQRPGEDSGILSVTPAENVVRWSIYTQESTPGITFASLLICRNLLDSEESTPTGTLFDNEFFGELCFELRHKSKARLVNDVGRLLVPSAAELRIRGEPSLSILAETVRQTWCRCIPLFPPSPDPEISVGFDKEAFTKGRMAKMRPHLGCGSKTSLFTATADVYFPFLVVEATPSLSPEGRNFCAMELRNTPHAATAMRGVVELFRYVDRAYEIDRNILTWSITYDTDTVTINGHYAVIDGKEIRYYQHNVARYFWSCNLSMPQSCDHDQWLSHRFVKSLYKTWALSHFERICSAIDDLPPGDAFSASSSLPGSESP